METTFCACGSVVEVGHEFCRVCGLSLGTTFEASSFEGDDEPTAVQPPEFARRAAREDARPRVAAPRPRVTRAPALAPVPAPAVGFRTGLLLGAGATGLVFGSIALVGIGYVVGTRNADRASLATIAEPALAARIAPAPAPAPLVEQRAALVAREVEPIAPAPIVAEPVAPAPVVAEPIVVAVAPREETRVVAKVEPKVEPRTEPKKVAVTKTEPKPVAKVEPKVVAKPEPKVIAKPEPKAVAKVEPKAAPAPVARPSRDELAALAATARQKAAPTVVAKPAPQPAAKPAPAYNWEENAAPAAAPAAAAWSFDDAPAAEPAAAPATSTPDPELEDILGAGPASAPAPAKVAARTPSARVIRARKGAVTIPLNANIALTRANGTPLVGKLVAVEGGFVDVKTSSAQLRIAEADVIEAATY